MLWGPAPGWVAKLERRKQDQDLRRRQRHRGEDGRRGRRPQHTGLRAHGGAPPPAQVAIYPRRSADLQGVRATVDIVTEEDVWKSTTRRSHNRQKSFA